MAQAAFQNVLRIALPILGIGWVAHYPLYDLPMGLEPSEDWLALRVAGFLVSPLLASATKGVIATFAAGPLSTGAGVAGAVTVGVLAVTAVLKSAFRFFRKPGKKNKRNSENLRLL